MVLYERQRSRQVALFHKLHIPFDAVTLLSRGATHLNHAQSDIIKKIHQYISDTKSFLR